MKSKMHSGYLWKANRNTLCWRGSSDKDKLSRRVEVREGEIVEFRYQHNAHFRVVEPDGKEIFLYLEEKDFLESFTPFAKIFENIRFRNQNSLAQILECKLYEIERMAQETQNNRREHGIIYE